MIKEDYLPARALIPNLGLSLDKRVSRSVAFHVVFLIWVVGES